MVPEVKLEGPLSKHKGAIFGVSLGPSIVTCDECGGSRTTVLTFGAHLGVFTNPRLAVMYNFVGFNDSEGNAALFYGLHTGALQYWPDDRVWIKGGAGLARLTAEASSPFSNASETLHGLGGTVSAGLSLGQTEHAAIDLSVQGSVSLLEGDSLLMFGALIGLTLF